MESGVDLTSIHQGIGEWLSGTGPMPDIVMSTRVRLARNLADFPFLTKASARQRTEIERFIRKRIDDLKLTDRSLLYLNLLETTAVDRTCLVERHLISRDHASSEGDRGVALGNLESVSIMVNEEDHLRIQVLRSGLQVEEAWSQISHLDDKLESRLGYAFNSEFGYLTACPTNVGTGLRISVMLHLPALVMTKQIEKVFKSVQKLKLAVRGYYGEGTQASGHLYQISNQTTLGESEEEICETVSDVIPQIIQYERNVREALLRENRISLEDKVWRAYGTLRSVRSITSEETMDLLSSIRLGVNLDLLDDVPIETVNDLFIKTQPAHLQKLEGRPLETGERDVLRASYIRGRLGDWN